MPWDLGTLDDQEFYDLMCSISASLRAEGLVELGSKSKSVQYSGLQPEHPAEPFRGTYYLSISGWWPRGNDNMNFGMLKCTLATAARAANNSNNTVLPSFINRMRNNSESSTVRPGLKLGCECTSNPNSGRAQSNFMSPSPIPELLPLFRYKGPPPRSGF